MVFIRMLNSHKCMNLFLSKMHSMYVLMFGIIVRKINYIHKGTFFFFAQFLFYCLKIKKLLYNHLPNG